MSGPPTQQSQDMARLERQARRLHSPPRWVTGAAWACLALGAVGVLVGLLVAPGRTWASLLANFLFWTGVAQSGVVMAAVFNVTYARWGRMMQRIAAGLGAFLPVSLLLLAMLYFGRRYLFVWLGQSARNPWLHAEGLFARDAAVLLVMTVLSLWFLYRSLRLDVGALSDERPVGDRFAAWLTRGWRGMHWERARNQRVLRNLSPAIIIGYALGYSVLALDLAMTLDPLFTSEMFPGIYFITEFYAALAVTTLLVATWRHSAGLEEIITPSHLLDLGNLTWAFTMLSGYVAWAQYIVIWYGNLPSQAAYLLLRSRVWPWNALAGAAIGLGFVVPFLFLFGRGLKRHPVALACIGASAAVGVLLERFLEVMPSVPSLEPTGYGLVEMVVTLGFAGAVALPYLWLIRRVPLFPVGDPLFTKALAVRAVEV
ncbi:MAG: hypothetical protein HY320_13465 [Armatimonadetes bacterium]|nr:hypothetical protein [Armatimonadota bacterium]